MDLITAETSLLWSTIFILIIALCVNFLFFWNLCELNDSIHPQNRLMKRYFPLLGMIPILNLIINFVIINRLRISSLLQAQSLGMNTQSIHKTFAYGTGFCILQVVGLVSTYLLTINSLGFIQIIALIMMIVFWVRTYQLRKAFQNFKSTNY